MLKEFGKGAAGNGKKGGRGAGDYSVVFTAALPMPAPLLRSLAKFGGTNVWCDEDAVIAASDTMVSLHASRSGSYTIQLPRRCHVIDALNGKTVGQNLRQLQVKINAPQTRTFLLD